MAFAGRGINVKVAAGWAGRVSPLAVA